MQQPLDGFRQFVEGIPALNQQFMRQAQGQALQWFDNSFQRQGFTNRIFIPWQRRKTADQPGKADTNRGARIGQKPQGRAILTGRGTLKRSGTGGVTPDGFWISYGNQNAPYAQAHNEGQRGPQQVKAHTRRSRRTGRTAQVRAFVRQANLPKRQFLGHSEMLMEQLARQYFADIRYLKAQTQGRIPS